MQVTDVNVHPVDNEHERLLGYASVVFDDEFVVHNIRLVIADNGVIVAMPNEEYRGEFRDIAHPISNDMRKHIQSSVLESYNHQVAEGRQIEVE